MALPYAKHTYGLLRDTAQVSRTVEAKYQEAVQTIAVSIRKSLWRI
jgi:hypothetical protein